MPEYITYPKPSDFKPEPTFTEGKRAGKPRCQGWARQAGRQCKRYPNVDKRVCRNHGGESLSGIASPLWVNGQRSKYLPNRLRDTYIASMQDKELLAMRNEISIIDTRIDDLFKRVDIGESGHLWLRSREVLLQLRKALATQDTKKLQEAIVELDDLIRRGSTDYGAWSEIGSSIDRKSVV